MAIISPRTELTRSAMDGSMAPHGGPAMASPIPSSRAHQPCPCLAKSQPRAARWLAGSQCRPACRLGFPFLGGYDSRDDAPVGRSLAAG